MESAFESVLNRTQSFSKSMQSVFKAMWNAIAKQLATDFTNKFTTAIAQVLNNQKSSNNQTLADYDNTYSQMGSSADTFKGKLLSDIQQELTKWTQYDTTKKTDDKTNTNLIKSNSNSTKTTVLQDITTMSTQLLEEMALMEVVSALFGSGESSSTSTSSVSLGRNSSSYYTVPSFDTGAYSLPTDMLALVRKNEMILPTDLADNIRSIGESSVTNNSSTSSSTGNIIVNSNFSPNTISGKGLSEVYKESAKQLTKAVKSQIRRGDIASSNFSTSTSTVF